MAGDWIKVEHATLDKPELGIASELLGISDGDAFLLFLRYWVWLDQNLDESRCGLVPFVSRKSLDRKFKCPGFASILERIGWASFDDEQQILTVANWERHNGKSAKSRALEQRKKADQRARLSRSCPDPVPQPAGPEKRREEKREVQEQHHEVAARGSPVVAILEKTKSASKGTRLEPDGKCPDEWRDWAVEAYGITPQRAVLLFIEFRDYWSDIPGAKGLKLRWFGTFKNRLRSLHERGLV
jgi:hypothetical protein